ncbi:hypothetical protein [uncultured Acinetobacter sp.]|uniref:hypothetical protein n=1 Tax=uncultured Acinetobacter sp. TaxID=165433 RepID=UPI002590D870|nr:hypothetical protein [uncultured Acinetobacter sp.]
MKKYFTVFLAFIIYFNVFSQAHAAGKNYNVKTIVYDPLEKVIQATTLDRIAEKTMQRTARVPVTSYATGSTVASMIRFGVAGALIYGVVEGAGWIIENGIVKKPKTEEIYGSTIRTTYSYQYSCKAQELKACIAEYSTLRKIQDKQYSIKLTTITNSNIIYQVDFYQIGSSGSTVVQEMFNVTRISNETSVYVPVPETELGEKVNNSPNAPQILPTVYNPNNPAGGLAPSTTADAIDRAAPTPEKEPTGGTKPKPNKDTNGDGIPDTYDPSLPSAGEEFQLPAFCEWATTMCAWYEKYQQDSKKTDEHRDFEKDIWKQEKQHRDDEKSFWEKVTDWFDWTKEEPEKEEEPERPEIDDQGIFSRTFDTVFSLSKQCPPDLPWSIDAYYFKGSYTINLNWLCMIFTFLGYPLQLLSHCIGLWIMYEAVIRKEIKW